MSDKAEEGEPGSTTGSEPAAETGALPPIDETSPAAHTPGRRRGRGLRLLFLLLLAAIAGFAAFLWYVKRDALPPVVAADQPAPPAATSTAAAIADVSAPVIDIESELLPLRQQLADLQRRHAAVEQSLTALADATASEIRELASRSTVAQAAPRVDWQLAEAEYLTRLAGQRVALEENPAAAIALLESADQILAGVGLPELREARRQIALDLGRLRAAPRVDREGLYLRLESLASGIAGLAGQRDSLAWNLSGDGDADTPGWFARQWRKLTDLVRRYVVVRRQEPQAQPVLEFSDEPLVQANMALLIRQAQLALLQQRSGIYATSLERLDSTLGNYYGGASTTAALRAEVAELAATQVVTDLPDMIGSSRAIREAIAVLNGTGLDTQGALQ